MSKQDWRELEAYRKLGKPEELCKKQSWISVKDKLPEDARMVLVYVQRLNGLDSENIRPPEYHIALRWKGTWWFMPREGCEITHWMPLPEPPKEDNNER